MNKFISNFSAKIVLTLKIKIIIFSIVACLITLNAIYGIKFIFICLCFINLIYVFATSYRLRMFLAGLKIADTNQDVTSLVEVSNRNLPTYTILVPLFKEATVIHSLKKALRAIDYPKVKLQILLIVEESDPITFKAIEEECFPSYFTIIVVPFSFPQTKAKACNYALNYAKGEYITIFDAEDRPEKLQLKQVVQKFALSNKNVICIQCQLSFYNEKENWLSKMFAIEYANLFYYTLPAISKQSYPVPLGGTSNHLKTKTLRRLGGWDSYNVTEDASLGLKIALLGFKTLVINSSTYEEAPISINAWLRQRARWIKGYFHTYFVYIRHPVFVFKRYKFYGFLFFNFFIFLSPFLLLTFPFNIYYYISTTNEFKALGLVTKATLLKCLCIFSFSYGFLYLTYIAYQIKIRKNATNLWFTYPFYFVLHIIAAGMAVYKLIVEPHKWDKTEHGISKITN